MGLGVDLPSTPRPTATGYFGDNVKNGLTSYCISYGRAAQRRRLEENWHTLILRIPAVHFHVLVQLFSHRMRTVPECTWITLEDHLWDFGVNCIGTRVPNVRAPLNHMLHHVTKDKPLNNVSINDNIPK